MESRDDYDDEPITVVTTSSSHPAVGSIHVAPTGLHSVADRGTAPDGETVIAEQADQQESTSWRILRRCRAALQFSKYGLGILLILCVTVIWVASSEWIQYIFGELEFSKPYFLTYFNTAGFSFWNLGFLLSRNWQKLRLDEDKRDQPIFVDSPDLVVQHEYEYACAARESRGDSNEDGRAPRAISRATDADAPTAPNAQSTGSPSLEFDDEDLSQALQMHRDACFDYEVQSSSGESACSEEEHRDVRTHNANGTESVVRLRVDRVRPYSLRRIWYCAALFCPFWFLANYLFNASLSITSVASNTVLSSTSSVWTLLMSVVLLNQSVGPVRLCAVALCMAGSIMVGLADNGSSGDGRKNTVFGDVIALASAFFYATYTSILKWGLPDDERYPMGAVFGAVGVINLVVLWPGLILLHGLGVESFALPSAAQFWPLLLNALIGTNLSDVLWARSVVLTSPVVATLGLSLTTPLAMVCDAILRGQRYSAVYIVGAVMVMVGFIVVNLPVRDRWCWSWRKLLTRLRSRF